MNVSPLLEFKGVVLKGESGQEVGPIDWVVPRAAKIWLECAHSYAFSLVAGAIAGNIRPVIGHIEELKRMDFQDDLLLKASIDLNRSIQDYLNSVNAPEFVWLASRKRALGVLLDRLGLAPNTWRRPLKMQPEPVQQKFWALRFMLSKADLLVGRELFALKDADIREALRWRWGDIPGTVFAGGELEDFPGTPEWHAQIRNDGAFSCRVYSAGAEG